MALRLKTIVLLSLSVMLQPSDIAPHSVVYDHGELIANQFKRSHIVFTENEMLQLYLFGIKNDYCRQGFCVKLPSSSEWVVCPVKALWEYVSRTQHLVGEDGPVFIALQRLFNGLTANGISGILHKAIDLAGLKGRGFTAKCFRPTGATLGVQAGVNPDVVRTVGRWKNVQTFEIHYVHANPPVGFTDAILNV